MKKDELTLYTQQSFKKLLMAMSRPGNIYNISEGELLDYKFNCMSATQMLMYVLLDGEVSFCALPQDSKLIEQVSRVTYSRNEEISKSDYIFITLNQQEPIEGIIKAAKRGTLENPNGSCTLIIETERISSEKQLVLTGPGIKDQAFLSVYLNPAWLNAREYANREFPLGVDIVFVDRNNNLAALPRTTAVKEWRI